MRLESSGNTREPMPDESSNPSSPPIPPAGEQASAPSASAEPISFNISEEFGTAKRNLPPAKIVLIGIGIIVVVASIVAFVQRSKPQGAGSIDNISAAQVPDQNQVLVAITVTLRNTGPKSLYIHDVKAILTTDAGTFSDDAASAADFDRYFQAFPALKEHAVAALLPETKIPPGASTQGTVIVSFPVMQDAFNGRKSVSVSIQPYDQPLPVVLTR